MAESNLLSSRQMMEFASRGFLKLDSVVPDAINQQFLSDIGHVDGLDVAHPRDHYRDVMATSTIPVVNAGVPLSDAYPADSALGKLLGLPLVTGAIQSLVGRRPLFDHHFLHIAFPPGFNGGTAQVSQHTHQDSTIDPRRSFDVQLMYYPHEVTKDMGGTRYIPGSHLRIVSEASIGRYQNILGQQHLTCNAGTLLFMHMGIWHGGGSNRSENMRYMFKVRICPTERQVRLWDDSDLPEDHNRQRPIFWTGVQDPQHLHSTLTTPEPWFEADTARLEYLNRIRFWRYLLGDNSFDADYWLTRVENEIN